MDKCDYTWDDYRTACFKIIMHDMYSQESWESRCPFVTFQEDSQATGDA